MGFIRSIKKRIDWKLHVTFDKKTGFYRYKRKKGFIYIRYPRHYLDSKFNEWLCNNLYYYHYMPKGTDTVVDLGTGYGEEALYLHDQSPNLNFYGIEIQPVIFECLANTLNSVSKNFKAISTAINSGDKIRLCSQLSYFTVGDNQNIGYIDVPSVTWKNFLLQNNTLGIYDIDTRKLVKHIRSKGVMNCIISTQNLDDAYLESELKKVPSMENLELASYVSTKKSYFYGNKSSKKKVAVLDLGCKKSILKNFESRNIFCKVFPAKTKSKDILNWKPDGFFISNGPGDPASMDYAVNTVGNVMSKNIPTFGICLGHQILARACGLATYKLHHGHRGINHPVKNLKSGKGEITSQNHGFAINREETEANNDLTITHLHLNDNTVAGIEMKNKNCFSVQYHPEASPGPHDASYLFDQFVSNISKNK